MNILILQRNIYIHYALKEYQLERREVYASVDYSHTIHLVHLLSSLCQCGSSFP